MKQEEIREVALVVSRKLWQNRRRVALTSNRLAVVALLQTLDRYVAFRPFRLSLSPPFSLRRLYCCCLTHCGYIVVVSLIAEHPYLARVLDL